MIKNYRFPEASTHGKIVKIFENIYFVSGSISIKGPVNIQCSRNMTIIKQGEALILINSIRLSKDGLKELDALGEVKHVMRIAGFHGMDDPFYKNRYQAKIWSVDAPYAMGFNKKPPAEKIYFNPDEILTHQTKLPVKNAELILIDSARPSEALVLLEDNGGTLISGDSLQNWEKVDEYFNSFSSFIMKLMGFIKSCNIGPGWLKKARPHTKDIQFINAYNYENLLPAHGSPIQGEAREKFKQIIGNLK